VKEAKGLEMKAHYFVALDQDTSNAIKYLEGLPESDTRTLYIAVILLTNNRTLISF